jgi:uncharacterized membrane protein YhaH (DUF805 family)
MKIFEKVDATEIVGRHFKTLFDIGSQKPCWSEITVFYILPILVIPSVVYTFDHSLTEKLGNLFFQAFAITGGFLINALVMLTDRRQHYDDSKKFSERVTLIEETYSNTAFGVLICFMIVLFAGIAVGTNSDDICITNICKIWSIIITSLVYYLTIIFAHTLGMVIKRLDKIFRS